MGKTYYKYTKLQYLDSILKDGGRLKLTCPIEEDENDEFDCDFNISKENKSKSFKLLEDVTILKEFSKNQFFRKIIRFDVIYNAEIQKMKTTHKYDESLPNLNLLLSFVGARNPDIKKGLAKQKAKFNRIFNKKILEIKRLTLIGSLTTKLNSNKMWSDYGDKCKGICVEYEIPDDIKVYKVKYTDEVNNFDLYTVLKYGIPKEYFNIKYDVNNDPEFQEVSSSPFFMKTPEWEVESEMRVLFSKSNKDKKLVFDNKYWFLPNVKIKSIYFGHKVSRKEIIEAANKCIKENIDIFVTKLEKCKNTYTIIKYNDYLKKKG